MERGPSAFQRLAPNASWNTDLLTRIESELEEEEVAAELEAIEQTRDYPAVTLERLRRLGLASLFASSPGQSEEASATVVHGCALSALAARRSGSLAITLGVNYLGLLPVYVAAEPELLGTVIDRVRGGAFAALLLTELDNGSNLLRNRLRARSVPEGEGPATHHVLSGEKNLINGGGRHDILVALARTREREGASLQLHAAAASDFDLFVVFRDATTRAARRWSTLPVHGANIADVRFEDTHVPASQRLGRDGEGFAIVQRALVITRGGVSAFASGAASGALDVARAYASRRDVTGAPIRTLGAIADHLVRMEALDLVVAATSIKAAAMANALGDGAAVSCAVAKYAGCLLAEEAVTEGRRILGSRALLSDSPYERFVRDVLVYGAFDGTPHLMLEQLQWRLTQVAAAATSPGAGAIEDTARLYSVPPRPLHEICRLRGRVFLPGLDEPVRAIARVRSSVPIEAMVALGGALRATVLALRGAGAWDRDQGLRFDAAAAYALFESALALVELADPDRRHALGLAPFEGGADHGSLYRAALGALGARVATAIRAVALRGGAPVQGGLLHAEESLRTMEEDGRRARVAELSRPAP